MFQCVTLQPRYEFVWDVRVSLVKVISYQEQSECVVLQIQRRLWNVRLSVVKAISCQKQIRLCRTGDPV